MVAFIEQHRGEYGVEPICDVLPIASSTYFEHRARSQDPAKRPGAKRDECVQRSSACGTRTIGVQRRRCGGNSVASRLRWLAAQRLMRGMGLRGAVRGRAFKISSGLVLTRSPLAFTELHLHFQNDQSRMREGTFQITSETTVVPSDAVRSARRA